MPHSHYVRSRTCMCVRVVIEHVDFTTALTMTAAWLDLCVVLRDFLLQLHPVSRGISIVSIYLTIACNCIHGRPRARTYDHTSDDRVFTLLLNAYVSQACPKQPRGEGNFWRKNIFLWGREDQLLTLLYRPTHRKTIAAETVLVRFCG